MGVKDLFKNWDPPMGKSLTKAKPHGAASLKPPREWWGRKFAEVKEGNPSYTDEQIRGTVGKMWYHEMSGKARGAKRHAEGKKYGPAEKSENIEKAEHKYYVGHSGDDMGAKEVFTHHLTPTLESHPQYKAVVGPFKTKRGATWAASPAAHKNPHYQHVDDAERIAREEELKIKKDDDMCKACQKKSESACKACKCNKTDDLKNVTFREQPRTEDQNILQAVSRKMKEKLAEIMGQKKEDAALTKDIQKDDTTHEEAKQIMSTARSKEEGKTLPGASTKMQERDKGHAVKYHATDVITIHPDNTYTLRSGGWKTATTRRKINQHLPSGVELKQRGGEWHIHDTKGNRHPFTEEMKIDSSGTPVGAKILQMKPGTSYKKLKEGKKVA